MKNADLLEALRAITTRLEMIEEQHPCNCGEEICAAGQALAVAQELRALIEPEDGRCEAQ